MIIESIDGRYYSNPIFLRDDWALLIVDESPFLFLTGKPPKELKVKNTVSQRVEQLVFADGKFKLADVFTFDLVRPLPTPDRWDTFYENMLPSDETIWTFSWPFTVDEILGFLKEPDSEPFVAEFLGKNPARKIREQVPFLIGARITNLNYEHYRSRLPKIIKLTGQRCREFIPRLAGPLAKTV